MELKGQYSVIVAKPGQNIGHFASEVINYRNKTHENIIAGFNGTWIEVIKDEMTSTDFVKEYYRLRGET